MSFMSFSLSVIVDFFQQCSWVTLLCELHTWPKRRPTCRQWIQ